MLSVALLFQLCHLRIEAKVEHLCPKHPSADGAQDEDMSRDERGGGESVFQTMSVRMWKSYVPLTNL